MHCSLFTSEMDSCWTIYCIPNNLIWAAVYETTQPCCGFVLDIKFKTWMGDGGTLDLFLSCTSYKRIHLLPHPIIWTNFSLHHHVQNSCGAHPDSYPMGTRGSFPGGKVARVGS
jgi:hypothetical protein